MCYFRIRKIDFTGVILFYYITKPKVSNKIEPNNKIKRITKQHVTMVRHPCKICGSTSHTASGCSKKCIRGALVYIELRYRVLEIIELWASNISFLYNTDLEYHRSLTIEQAEEKFIRDTLMGTVRKFTVLDLKLLGEFVSDGEVLWIPILRAIPREGPFVIADEDNVPSTHYKKSIIKEEICNFMYHQRGENLISGTMSSHIIDGLPQFVRVFITTLLRQFFPIVRRKLILIFDHINLIFENINPNPKLTILVDENMIDDDEDCPICMESMSEKMVIMNCNHKCCADCMKRVLGTKAICCLCRAPVNTVNVSNEETSKSFKLIKI